MIISILSWFLARAGEKLGEKFFETEDWKNFVSLFIKEVPLEEFHKIEQKNNLDENSRKTIENLIQVYPEVADQYFDLSNETDKIHIESLKEKINTNRKHLKKYIEQSTYANIYNESEYKLKIMQTTHNLEDDEEALYNLLIKRKKK